MLNTLSICYIHIVGKFVEKVDEIITYRRQFHKQPIDVDIDDVFYQV